MEKMEREMLHYLMITTKMIMLGLEKMIRASTFTLHFALCFYHFVILNS